jgi:hypothetical protein
MPGTHHKRSRQTGKPGIGFQMELGDTVPVTNAGMNVDTNGQPFILNKDGDTVMSWPSDNVVAPVWLKIALTAGDGSGVISSTANPFGFDVIIVRAVLNITTQSTAAATADIGVDADSDTADDRLIDGLSLATAGLYNNVEDPGTNGEMSLVWDSAEFLTVAEASGDVTGFVGSLYLECIRAI